MVGVDSQFGFPEEEIPLLPPILECFGESVSLLGVHIY